MMNSDINEYVTSNERDGVSSHLRLDYLFNRLFRHGSKQISNCAFAGSDCLHQFVKDYRRLESFKYNCQKSCLNFFCYHIFLYSSGYMIIVHILTMISESLILKPTYFYLYVLMVASYELLILCLCICKLISCILFLERTLTMWRNCFKLKRWISQILMMKFLEISDANLRINWMKF